MSKKSLVRLLVKLYGDPKREKKFQGDRKKFVARKNLTKEERAYLVDGDVTGLRQYLGAEADNSHIVDEKLSHIVDSALSHIVDSALARAGKKAKKAPAKKGSAKKAPAKKRAGKTPAKRRPKPKK